MKRSGGMMYPRNKRQKAEKLACKKCGKELTPATAYYYVDGCNCSITSNAPAHCKECYIEKYGRR